MGLEEEDGGGQSSESSSLVAQNEFLFLGQEIETRSKKQPLQWVFSQASKCLSQLWTPDWIHAIPTLFTHFRCAKSCGLLWLCSKAV